MRRSQFAERAYDWAERAFVALLSGSIILRFLPTLTDHPFNAVLLKELKMIALLRQLADPGHGEGAQWAGMRIHLVRNPIMADLGYSSKLNAEWEFVTMLFGEGRRAANDFLKTNGEHLGERSTADLDMLLSEC